MLRAPAVARHGLEALAEAQNRAAHQSGALVGDGDRRQGAVPERAGKVVDDHRGGAHQAGAQEGGDAHAGHLLVDGPSGREIGKAQLQHGLPAQEGQEQHQEGDCLGDGRGNGGARHLQPEGVDEQRVQRHVDHAAGDHAQHGIAGAALRAQHMAQRHLPRGEGGGDQDEARIAHGVRLCRLRGAQKGDQGTDEDKGERRQRGEDDHAGEQRGIPHAAGFLVLFRPQEAGDIAGRADPEAHGAGADEVGHGVVDAHGGGGGLAQLAHEIRVRDVVKRVHHHGDHHGDGEERHDLSHRVGQHHPAPLRALFRL